MSFLDSVLSSIGTGASTPTAPPTKAASIKKPELSTIPTTKRKAEDDLRRSVEKSTKLAGSNGTNAASRPIKSLPARSDAVPKAVSPAQAPAPIPNKQPKKGTFAAIMARAKEGQAQAAQIGSITHKPKEKQRSHKEIVAERELAKKAAKRGVPVSKLLQGKDMSKKSVVEKQTPPTVKTGYQGTIKPTAEKPGYKGTAKPAVSSYTGTARSTYSGAANNRAVAASKAVGAKYRRNQDESDEEMSEDQYDYASEDYSDMDAGFDDLDHEEEEAERIARKEDAAAKAELDRLAREKERKKALLLRNSR